MRIKICGITSIVDALAAVQAGADAIGLVFYAPSPRSVTVETAREIVLALPPFVTSVGLFVNAQANEIQQVLSDVPLGLLQFHGDEMPADCERWQRPYIKAVRFREDTDFGRIANDYAGAAGILVDTYVKDVPGGTGLSFDWSLLPGESAKPLILAGGLTPENVAEAIQIAHPYGVDVSGGVEIRDGAGQPVKGRKDPRRMQAFVDNALIAGRAGCHP